VLLQVVDATALIQQLALPGMPVTPSAGAAALQPA
jgi:hypothetical protein